jgi:hypothetical protein
LIMFCILNPIVAIQRCIRPFERLTQVDGAPRTMWEEGCATC